MRIVSLCPSLTELVFDLGRGDDLVGITKFCVHPADRVESVERVGGTKDPKVGRIFELAPDLVLMNEEENRSEDHRAFVEAGLRCSSSFPKDPQDAADMVREIADLLDRRDEGEAIAAEIERLAGEVRSRVRPDGTVRFAYLVWREPWIAVGPDTFIDGMLRLAGGRNVVPPGSLRYPTVDLAGLGGLHPDLVMLSSEPFPFQEKHRVEISRLAGLPPERVVRVDGELLSWHGSRTRLGIPYAERCLRVARRPASLE